MAPWNRKKRPPHRFASHQVAVPFVETSVMHLRARLESWQQRVLGYAEIIPEVMTGYTFVHNTMDLVTFEIQRFDRAENDWVADDSPAIQGIERKINTAFKAGRAAALGHLIAEAYILVTRTAENGFCFETLSPTEIKSKGKNVTMQVVENGEKDAWVAVHCDTTIIRVFTPDPSDRNRASGPHKALLGLLETMALELSRDQADAISVLAGNGILYIPTEVLPDEVDTLDASDTPGSRKNFENALEDAMIATIADRQRGDAVMPITLYGPAEYATSIVHILPKRAESTAESNDRMDHLINRYASSIDLPKQSITGTGDANHWSDWLVDPNTWAYHLGPNGQRIADALYAGLVKRIICNLHLDPDDYRMVPNATKAMVKADISGAARDAYSLGAITPEAYVEAIGFDASDMRDDAEEALFVLKGVSSDFDSDGSALSPTPPDRSAAASTNPRIILRQAAKAAASHQNKLDKIMRRYLGRVAEDAARDGRAVKKQNLKAAPEATSSNGNGKKAAAYVPFDGYVPGHYFTKYADELAKATNDELFAYLKRIATLTNADYKLLKAVWASEFTARAQAVVQQANIISEGIAKSSFNSGKPSRIGDSPIRSLTSTANGGVNESNGAAGNTRRPTQAGEDVLTKDVLQDAVGSYATVYTWVVGDPMRPFEPHQDLAGETWQSWQEFDKLEVPADDSWLPGSVFFPGDHNGCQCDYEIDFVPSTEVEA